MLARTRAHVHHMIGGKYGVLVMFHHDDAIAEIAQVLERFQQASVVPLVQADGRLIQHIHHAGQA